MKNLHFYIQCLMLLLALSFAVQIPLKKELAGFVVLMECLIGIYQLGMSMMLFGKLSKHTLLMEIHLFGSMTYLILLAVLGMIGPTWMSEMWPFALYVFPWAIAIFFLVTIDELERKRNYRL